MPCLRALVTRCAAAENGMERCDADHLARGVACDFCVRRARRRATIGRMAKKKRGPGRPQLPGEVLFVRGVVDDVAKVLDELDQAHELGGRAATARAILQAVRDDEKVRAAIERALKREK